MCERPLCDLATGKTDAASCKNLHVREDETLRRRPGLSRVAIFDTGLATFKGSRNGEWVTGYSTAPALPMLYNVSIGASASTAWISGLSLLATTTNTGVTWTTQSTASQFYNLDFVSDTVGFACSSGGGKNFYSTTDGGATWNAVGAFPATFSCMKISFFNATVGIAIGGGTTPPGTGCDAFYTTDGGATWLESNLTAVNLWGCWMASATVGYATAVEGIYKTTDGGATWTLQIATSCRAVHGSSATVVWAVGLGGIIVATTDGGTTWAAQTSGVSTALLGVWAASSTVVYAVGAGGVIRKTTDGGTTWGALVSGVTTTLTDCEFSSTTAGWVVGNATLLVTADGTTWTAQALGTAAAYAKWAIGGDDGEVYEVSENIVGTGILKYSDYAPYRLQFRKLITGGATYIQGIGGASNAFKINTAGTWSTDAIAAVWRFATDRYNSDAGILAGSPNSATYRGRIYFGADYIEISFPGADVAAIGVLPNQDVIALKDDGSCWYVSGSGVYFARRLAKNLGTIIPYSVQSVSEEGVFFATTDGIYFTAGGKPILLSRRWKSITPLTNFDDAYLWKAGSGYDPRTRTYYLTYLQTTGTWRTIFYDQEYDFFGEFVNAEFDEGSFYNKARNFYVSLDTYTLSGTVYAPGMYLLQGFTTADPNAAMDCEYQTGEIFDSESKDAELRLYSVRVVGTGWDTVTVSYQDSTGTWTDMAAASLSSGIVTDGFPTGGADGRRFKVKLNGSISGSEDCTLEELILNIGTVWTGP